MCPLYPLHLVFTWGFLFLFLWVYAGQSLASALGASSNSSSSSSSSSSYTIGALLNNVTLKTLDLKEEERKELTLFVDDLPPDAVGEIVMEEKAEGGLTHMQLPPDPLPLTYDSVSDTFRAENVSVTGAFLGFSNIKLTLSSDQLEGGEAHTEIIRVKVHREPQVLDSVFIYVIVLLVVIAYVNMGSTISLDVIKATLRRPVAPAIGLASQYLFMPLVAYGIGYAFFSKSPELWLGLFLTGCAPGGGGSNMWTYLLGGSLDLSVTMTFFSTLFAFATLPLWVMALGPSIFADGSFGRLPYRNMAMLVFGLVVPCGIGLGIRRCCPKAADFLKKMLKPICIFFIVFVMSFGVYVKFYLFSFFTWKVALAGLCLPFFGFAFGAAVALVLRRSWEEVVAISVETGVQNTGLAIGVLKIALRDFSPLDDIAIVLPVAVATMTPFPLLFCWVAKYLKNRRTPKREAFGGESCAVAGDALEGQKINNNSKTYVSVP